MLVGREIAAALINLRRDIALEVRSKLVRISHLAMLHVVTSVASLACVRLNRASIEQFAISCLTVYERVYGSPYARRINHTYEEGSVVKERGDVLRREDG